MNQGIRPATDDAASRITVPGTPVAGEKESTTTAPAARPEYEMTVSAESRPAPLNGKQLYWQDLVSVLHEVQAKTAAAGGARHEEEILSRQLSAHVLENTLAGISMLDLTKEDNATLQEAYAGMRAAAVRSGAGSIVTGTTTAGTAGISDRELCQKIAELMNNANDKYLKNYEYAVGKQAEYWKKITQFQKALSDCVSTKKDKVVVDVPRLRTVWHDLGMDRQATQLYPGPDENGVLPFLEGKAGKKEAYMWAADFGPGVEVIKISSPKGGKYYVSISSSEREAIKELIWYNDEPGKGDPVEMSTTNYQAWLTSMNSQVENIKTNSQTLTTKYSSANSLYDSLIKLLTATVTTLFDSCKEYLRW